MKLILFVKLLWLLSAEVGAQGISNKQSAACVYAVQNVTRTTIDCSSPVFIGSVVLCIEEHASNRSQITKAYKYVQDVCEYQLKRKMGPTELDDYLYNATTYLNGTTASDKDSALQISKTLYDYSLASVDNLVRERWKATKLGWALLGYWGLILTASIVINCFQWCFPAKSSQIKQHPYSRWLRRHVLTANSVKLRPKRQESKWMVKFKIFLIEHLPLRIHIATLSIYIILIVVLCCIDYDIHNPNIVFRCKRGQTLVWVADRTGIIGITQFPLIYLFTARNNPLIAFSGFSYKTFNIFHKWVSRIIWVLLVLHAVCYVFFATTKGDYIARWGLTKWQWANIAISCISVSLFISFFKKRFYEIFKVSHKVLVLLFTIGVGYHCISLGWMEYLYASIAIWACDYLLRFVKIVVSGGVVQAKCKVIFETRVSNRGYKDVPHSIRVEAIYSGWWRSFPGCYVWVTFLRKDMFWEAHPFTFIVPAASNNHDKLVFDIRVKNGLTRRLGKLLQKQENYELTIPVLIEGPYGNTIPYKSYEHAIFTAGGVGFTALFSIAIDLARYFTNEAKNDGRRRSIEICWVCSDIETVYTFEKELKSLGELEHVVHLNIYITKFQPIPLSAREQGLEIPLGIVEENNAEQVVQEGNEGGGHSTGTNNFEIELERDLLYEISSDDIEDTQNRGFPSDSRPQGTERTDEETNGSNESIKTNIQNVFEMQDFNKTNTLPTTEEFYDLERVFGREEVTHHSSQLEAQNQLIIALQSDEYSNIEVHLNERPNLVKVVTDTAFLFNGPIAIIACGPQRFCLDVRTAAAKCLGRVFVNKVDYYEEDLLW